MYKDDINNEYFEWLYDSVGGNDYADPVSYRKLLMQLHNISFYHVIPLDENRAQDGLTLRYRFSVSKHYNYDMVMECMEQPCTVLEMMVALAIRCEENIMDDTRYGNRTSQWFWTMIKNLGLSGMTANNYDKLYITEVITKFLDRDYEPDGKGGLFRIRNCKRDLRNVEIWIQLNWYLNEFLGD